MEKFNIKLEEKRTAITVPVSRKWLVINGLRHSVVVSYAGKGKTLAPGENWPITNANTLGPLPSGVRCVPVTKQ